MIVWFVSPCLNGVCFCAQIETINEAFVTARDEIEYAKEVLTSIPEAVNVLMSTLCHSEARRVFVSG